ncbi:hypothetical protein [Paraburkholderia sp. GAS348]|uniref:hypothetical protein n=1 Tax=Paraburkholderia sp. GAS348 TaxID=3035132 RepID=UPI003D1E938E
MTLNACGFPLDDFAAHLADMDADIALLEQDGHPTKRLKRSIAGLRRQLDTSAAIRRDRIGKMPRPNGDDQ